MKYPVMSKATYKDANGKERERWRKIGKLSITSSGKKYLELYHLPNIVYHVFDSDTDPEEE